MDKYINKSYYILKKNGLKKIILIPFFFGIFISLALVSFIYFTLIKNNYIDINLDKIIKVSNDNYISTSIIYKTLCVQLLLLGIIMLASLSQIKKYIYSIIMFMYGFKIGFVITFFFVENKFIGLLNGFLCYFPHEYIYFTSNVIAMHSFENFFDLTTILSNIKKYIIINLFLISVVFIGIICELWISPIIMNML